MMAIGMAGKPAPDPTSRARLAPEGIRGSQASASRKPCRTISSGRVSAVRLMRPAQRRISSRYVRNAGICSWLSWTPSLSAPVARSSSGFWYVSFAPFFCLEGKIRLGRLPLCWRRACRPPVDQPLLADLQDIIDQPVQNQTRRKAPEHEREYDRHHPAHHLGLSRIAGGR